MWSHITHKNTDSHISIADSICRDLMCIQNLSKASLI